MVKKVTSKDIAKAIIGSRLPFRIVKIRIDPKITKEVNEYVQRIEEAHKRASKSTLHFKAQIRDIGLSSVSFNLPTKQVLTSSTTRSSILYSLFFTITTKLLTSLMRGAIILLLNLW